MGGQLTFPHCSRASLLGSLPVSLVHILSPVTDNCPFLNQRKGDNGRRNCFMTILLPRMCAGREDESATGRIPGGRASDRVTTHSKEI